MKKKKKHEKCYIYLIAKVFGHKRVFYSREKKKAVLSNRLKTNCTIGKSENHAHFGICVWMNVKSAHHMAAYTQSVPHFIDLKYSGGLRCHTKKATASFEYFVGGPMRALPFGNGDTTLHSIHRQHNHCRCCGRQLLSIVIAIFISDIHSHLTQIVECTHDTWNTYIQGVGRGGGVRRKATDGGKTNTRTHAHTHARTRTFTFI